MHPPVSQESLGNKVSVGSTASRVFLARPDLVAQKVILVAKEIPVVTDVMGWGFFVGQHHHHPT
jgi:hypothetical protein